MGTGTISIPYVYYENGFYMGTLFIVLSAVLSMYSGYLLTLCAAETRGTCYEDIALKLFGYKGMIITSFCNILCNIGFVINYIVLVSSTSAYSLLLVQKLSALRM